MEINEAENNILTILLLYTEKQSYIFDKCKEEFFIDNINRRIFKIAKKIYENGLDVDNVSIFEESNKNKLIGDKLIKLLTENVVISANIRTYCNILAKEYVNRMIKQAKDVDDFEEIESIKNNFLLLDDNKIKHISYDAENFIKRYEKQKNGAIVTLYENLDKYIGSFQGGDYIALGGATRMGKTTFALNLAKFICAQDKHVMYCSLEMPLNQLQNRFASLTAGLNASKFRSIGFTKEELEKYQKALNTLKDWKLYTVCDYELTVEKLKIYAMEQKKKGLDFIIIDYLGLISGYNNKSLYEKSTVISRKIKLLATELNVPILVLVQLNRSLKDRQDKRPILSDIRESGAIEQDADFVLFAHRPYVYSQDIMEKEKLEIIIAKNRHGESDVICPLLFNATTQEINNIKYYNDFNRERDYYD
ncbi:replicative DNA helicase [Faecalibacillus faecis]|uniref:replicative DNA helicase n=1 Tax=Faecalibacillus faecis TaxID=1982628 RepID=UPI0038656A29